MSKGFPNDFGGPSGTDDVETECRACEHTIEATVHEIDSHADTWVRCSECRTINRVTGQEINGDTEDAEA